jgi:hypothetical protein
MLNSKLKTLNSKQTQMSKTQNSKPCGFENTWFGLLRSQYSLLSFIFWICFGFRVWGLEFKQLRISIFEFRIWRV